MTPRFLFVSLATAFFIVFILLQLLYSEPINFANLKYYDYNNSRYPIKVAFLIFATGKYLKFADVFISSMRKYFDCPICNVTYVVFTDNTLRSTAEDIVWVDYKLRGWPYDSLQRVHAFKQNKDKLRSFSYLFAIDADMRVRDRVGMEILGDLVGTLHPGFYHNRERGTFENNTRSSAYVRPSEGGYYFAGGFYGARAAEFWKLVDGTIKLIDADMAKNYIAIYHDESYLNRYFSSNPPTILLSAAYCAPQLFRPSFPYEKKIIAREKRHSLARS